ncbi:MAG: shikimate kinase, partial [Methanomicrobium sp.]|nr:shikimate kinase [Methanomicrobium sp.]
MGFFETDSLIEKLAGMDIPEIFLKFGETHFRKLERDVIRSLPSSDCVVSTGGGAVLDDENAKNLRRNSYAVFLDVDTKTSYERISESTRPALTGYDPEDEVKILIRERFPQYARTSDICIDASKSPEDICDEIAE